MSATFGALVGATGPRGSAVADACPEFMAAEAVVLDYLKGSEAIDPIGFDAARAECQARIRKLGDRLRALSQKNGAGR